MVEFVDRHGMDGVFCCGTTGEGILVSVDVPKQVAAALRQAVRTRLIVHCGAQTTADAVAPAARAAEIHADGVAGLPPPYYPMDDAALLEHLVAHGEGVRTPPLLHLYVRGAERLFGLAPDDRPDAGSRRQPGRNQVLGSPFAKVAAYLTRHAGVHRL